MAAKNQVEFFTCWSVFATQCPIQLRTQDPLNSTNVRIKKLGETVSY